MKPLAAGIGVCTMLLALPATTSAQSIKLGEAMVFYIPALKPDADVKAFEAFVAGQVAPAWAKQAPGMTLTRQERSRKPSGPVQSHLVDGTWGVGMAAAGFEAKEWTDWTVVTAR